MEYLIQDSIYLIDENDFSLISKYNWYIDKDGYAKSSENKKDIFMHRLINQTPEGMFTDHVNGKVQDNRKENLRTCTNQENQWNSKPQNGTSSIYKGVSKRKFGGFEVNIMNPDGNSEYLGKFNDELAAANCYNHFAVQYFGEFARINDVPFMEWKDYKNKLDKTSKYRGVFLSQKTGKWEARIYENKKQKFLGYFLNEEDAVISRNEYIIKNNLNKKFIQKIF